MARPPIIVEFWDVGQGDATVIRPDPTRVFLIDVGPRNSPVVQWIASNSRLKVEGIVLTHNDADHAGALSAFIEAVKSPIKRVYFLVDENPKNERFAALFANLDRAYKAGHVKEIIRLEAPQLVWVDPTGSVEISVRYPAVLANVAAQNPNQTAGVLTLNVSGKVRVIWASDAPLEQVAATCCGRNTEYMVGPHHGAPTDRRHPAAEQWLADVGARTNVISVGSNNGYDHPQKSYLRKVAAVGTRIMCTQLTPLCDKARSTDVVKAHARYALPQPNTGIACHGPIRVMLLPSDEIIGDELDVEHQQAILQLQRPQCIRLQPRNR